MGVCNSRENVRKGDSIGINEDVLEVKVVFISF
jgi:hypothetical protein